MGTLAGPASDRPTTRQIQLLELLAAGQTTKQMAFRLGISQSAVKKHFGALMRSYSVENRIGLLVAVLAAGHLSTSGLSSGASTVSRTLLDDATVTNTAGSLNDPLVGGRLAPPLPGAAAGRPAR